jgi:predicted trehalose synthase
MSDVTGKERVLGALRAFGDGCLRDNAITLLNALGYSSEKTVDLTPNTAARFRSTFDQRNLLLSKHALTDEWKSVDLLFQLTDEEVTSRWQGKLSFSKDRIDNVGIESYLFFAIELAGERYTRTKLAGITRPLLKCSSHFSVVVMLSGGALSLTASI